MAHNPLGRQVPFPQSFAPQVLCAVDRGPARVRMGITGKLPFTGYDLWNCYELSFLLPTGRPVAAILQFVIPCESSNLIESKSLKLFLGSLNNTTFNNFTEVSECIRQQLERVVSTPLLPVHILKPEEWHRILPEEEMGHCIDDCRLDSKNSTHICTDSTTDTRIIDEHLVSHVLRSLCPVTGQPDWATVDITYRGLPINHSSILQFIVSLRNESAFHEETCEKLFLEILQQTHPIELLVSCRYLRRGGIDICPVRFAPKSMEIKNLPRHIRQ